jgi:hypothetical protein
MVAEAHDTLRVITPGDHPVDYHPVAGDLPLLRRQVDYVADQLANLHADGGRAMGFLCGAHRHDSWVPIEVHHVWPVGEGGPNVATNRVPLCSNAHSAVHDLLGRMLKGEVPWDIRRRYGYAVRVVADRGYAEIMAHR